MTTNWPTVWTPPLTSLLAAVFAVALFDQWPSGGALSARLGAGDAVLRDRGGLEALGRALGWNELLYRSGT